MSFRSPRRESGSASTCHRSGQGGGAAGDEGVEAVVTDAGGHLAEHGRTHEVPKAHLPCRK